MEKTLLYLLTLSFPFLSFLLSGTSFHFISFPLLSFLFFSFSFLSVAVRFIPCLLFFLSIKFSFLFSVLFLSFPFSLLSSFQGLILTRCSRRSKRNSILTSSEHRISKFSPLP